MKHLFFFSFLVILSLSACGGKQNTTAGVENEMPPTDTVAVEVIPELPPLEAGEVFLKGKEAFSEEAELTGTHIEEPGYFHLQAGRTDYADQGQPFDYGLQGCTVLCLPLSFAYSRENNR